MSTVTVLVFVAAAICCGLCVYGIRTAIRRSKDRREQGVHAD